MPESKPHSAQDDFVTLRHALTMDEGTIVERRHTSGHSALDRIEEQLQTAQNILGEERRWREESVVAAQRLQEQVQTLERSRDEHAKSANHNLEAYERLLEQLEAANDLVQEAHRFALVLAELKVATRPFAEAWLVKYRVAYPASERQ